MQQFSRKKTKWMRSRGRRTAKGHDIKINRAIASRYRAKIRDKFDSVISSISEAIEKELRRMNYKEGILSSDQYTFFSEKMDVIEKEVLDDIELFAYNTSGVFAKKIDSDVVEKTRNSIQTVLGIDYVPIMNSEKTKGMLEIAIKENVNLIRGLGDDVMKNVNTIVSNAFLNGQGAGQIFTELQEIPKMTERRSKLIAYDQTRKMTQQLGIQRSRDAGAKKFEWVHSGKDANPRRRHLELDGQVFEYENPPVIEENPQIRGFPSQLINCKCRAIPVFDLEDFN